jgi:hypothetical protein
MAEGADTPSEMVITAEIVEVVVEEPGRAAKKTRGRQMPKWETDARDRVRAAVRRFAKPLADLVARDANEGDTGCWSPTSCAMDWATTNTKT